MRLGIIGCGFRAQVLLKAFAEQEVTFEDILLFDRAAQAAQQRIAASGVTTKHITVCQSAQELLDAAPDGVMVATNCNTHTPFALEVMERQLPLFLEKPVCTTPEQLRQLAKGAAAYRRQAMVSFPLRGTPLCKRAKAIIDSGALGRVEHVQAVNNVPYGGVYYHDWYRDEKVTGGLFLQKATHDVDYIFYLLGAQPVEVAAMESKTVFTGDRPAQLKCADCAERRTCDESPFVLQHRYNRGPAKGEYCCFSTGTGNHDSATMLMRMADGRHVVYSQNFYARRLAARRGARFIGYKGTMEMDFPSGTITVYGHQYAEKQVYTIDQQGLGHFGGDRFLIEGFLQLIADPAAPSAAPLRAGIDSAALCLAAAQSARQGVFLRRSETDGWFSEGSAL